MDRKTQFNQSPHRASCFPRPKDDSNLITSLLSVYGRQYVIMPVKNKTKSKHGSLNTKPIATEQPLPNWPALTPILSALDLSLEETLKDQILVVRNLFTSTLCKNYISYLSTLPLTTTPGKPKRGEATRVNDRFQVSDPVFAQRLWNDTALKALVTGYTDPSTFGGEILGLNSNIRIYRYTPSQFFDKHYDESNRISFGPEATPGKTTWTLLIYLSTCEGGETIFYPEPANRKERTPDPIVCGLEVGMALLHRHGDDCLLHEGAEVKSGEKWVLRSDLVVKR